MNVHGVINVCQRALGRRERGVGVKPSLYLHQWDSSLSKSNPGSAKPIIGASDRRQFAYVEKALSCLEIVREIKSELWTNCAVEEAKS